MHWTIVGADAITAALPRGHQPAGSRLPYRTTRQVPPDQTARQNDLLITCKIVHSSGAPYPEMS
jgi:hypothetical protein